MLTGQVRTMRLPADMSVDDDDFFEQLEALERQEQVRARRAAVAERGSWCGGGKDEDTV